MKKMTLKAARHNKDLTQKQVAKEVGVSNKTISKWENGICMPNSKYIDKLCELYSVNYDEINFLPSHSL